MQRQGSLSRDEWVPARRRRLSRERELTRQRVRNGERPRNETGTDLDPIDSGRRHDGYEDEARSEAA